MTYKVFLVEDEIVTREGIRDMVDWAAAGYQFVGEAPDGEIALPLIHERRPDTVITDIKMPFMDGLQLCRILRETLPATKIIILSGHDEFRYAQEAIQVGVTEYLLKPIAPQDLLAALRKVARQIDDEQQTSAHLLALEAQMASQRSLLRERCLLDLVSGSGSAAELLEQARGLDLDLLAPWYQVVVLRAAGPPADSAVAEFAREAAALAFKRGPGEHVLIVRGEAPGALAAHTHALAASLQRRIAERGGQAPALGLGQPAERLGMVAQSFAQALAQLGAGEVAPDRQAQDHSHSAALAAKARAFIDANYADPAISLSQVAAHVLLSPTYFSQVFARELGETFIEYLTNVRIRRAIELLRTTALTSSEIAYQVGYHNPRYFFSVFRKVAGLPPNEFRRQQT